MINPQFHIQIIYEMLRYFQDVCGIQECCVCYENTVGKLGCNHTVCPFCSDNLVTCPLCRKYYGDDLPLHKI